jgi:mono/diheme cytochrome c family protein
VAAVDLIATLGGLVLKFILMATLALATSAAAQSSLERGDYLVNAVMACDGCHTPRAPAGFVMEKRFSGGSQTWDDPAYTVKGSNITPDPDTGIGRWSESDIKISLTEGLRPYGMPLAPQMLFIFYKIMTPRDLDSVVTYLRSVPAVKNSVQPPVYRAVTKVEIIPGGDKPLDQSALRNPIIPTGKRVCSRHAFSKAKSLTTFQYSNRRNSSSSSTSGPQRRLA